MKSKIKERIVEFAHALIDQDKANVIIEPNSNSKGFWLEVEIWFFIMECIIFVGVIVMKVTQEQELGQGKGGLSWQFFPQTAFMGHG